MIEELLQQEEGKTLEFKENSKGLAGIIHTIIAFANTAFVRFSQSSRVIRA